jgi:5-methylcytosine-specific restriction endonuclease McrA
MLRDRYTCQLCGSRRRARELEVDHVVEIARGGAALDYANLRTVCRICHREKTRRFLSERNGLSEPPTATRG